MTEPELAPADQPRRQARVAAAHAAIARRTAARLADVVAVARQAEEAGADPVVAVAEAQGVGRSGARRLLRMARRLGWAT